MIDVEHWAEIRRMHFVDGVSIREIRRRTGLHRETIRRALGADRPLAYRRRAEAPSKLDPFKEEIERLLRADHRIPNTRIRELLAELGYGGGKTILDDHLREVRPRFTPKRTYQRTVYRPGRSASSTSGSPGRRSRSATGRPGGAGWSRAPSASRAPAP